MDVLNVGDAEAVGVRYYPATSDHPPIRLFYPAHEPKAGTGGDSNHSRLPVRWLDGESGGSLPFVAGFMHIALARSDTRAFKLFFKPLAYVVSWLLPMSWLRLGGVYKNARFVAPPKSTESLPAIVFSHGLTGTGQENTALCASWAKQGFIVACVHHTDGSSCHVRLANGTEQFYVHGPPYSNYDASFRPSQVKHRASEMIQTCQFLTSRLPTSCCPSEIREAVDSKRIIAAGFSFGAATVAQAVVTDKSRFCAALLLDGWFHIDVMESAGIEFAFPKDAFDHGLQHIPCLFICSEQFQGYPKIFRSTKELAAAHELHTLKGTGHQNFIDIVFWFNIGLLRRVLTSTIGQSLDPVHAFRNIVERSSTFMRKVTRTP